MVLHMNTQKTKVMCKEDLLSTSRPTERTMGRQIARYFWDNEKETNKLERSPKWKIVKKLQISNGVSQATYANIRTNDGQKSCYSGDPIWELSRSRPPMCWTNDLKHTLPLIIAAQNRNNRKQKTETHVQKRTATGWKELVNTDSISIKF